MKQLRRLLLLLLTMACLSLSAFALEGNTTVTGIHSATLKDSAVTLAENAEDCYVYLADNSYNACFVRYSSVQIDFAVSGTRSDRYLVTALVDDEENIYVYTEDALSKFDISSGMESIVSLTFDLDYTIPAGEYFLLYGIVDANEEPVDGIYIAPFTVAAYATALRDINFCDPDFDFNPIEQIQVCPDESELVALTYTPVLATGYRDVVYTSSDESIFTVETWAGYGYVSAVSSGRATLTATVNGTVTATIPVFVGHNYVELETVPATCSTTGKSTYQCEACGDGKEEELPIDPDAHDYGEQEPVVITAATACKTGQSTCHCDLCQQDIILELPALFTDTQSGRFYTEAVDYFYAEGIINGMTTTTFEPNLSLSRGMLVTFLYRMAGSPECGAEIPFTDVQPGRYFTTPIAWAYSNGLAKGITDTTFEPMTDITREELATFIYRYASLYKGLTLTETADLSSFPDADTTHNYAKEYMSWAVATGIVTGSSDYGIVTLSPRGSATRAQAATMLKRYLDYEAAYEATPEEPENPDEDDTTEPPTDPETPDEGETPTAPETPDEGETPTAPETPDEGETPTDPETPDEGETPTDPETPDEGETPMDPETPDEGETPADPETPDEDESSADPETPEETPDNSSDPTIPDEDGAVG